MDKLYNYQGTLVDLTDDTLTETNVPADSRVVGERFGDVAKASNQNCKIIAHTGYPLHSHENTIDAFIEAYNDGFRWLEIDMRPTQDGVYVLSHNATITLYNNGSSVYVNLDTTNYSAIAGYTWDSAGEYPLSTLQAAFNALRLYDLSFVCDRKAGNNADIVEIATKCSALDKILLSYPTFAAAYAERELLNKYPSIPIRVWPGDPQNVDQLRSVIKNPIYADVNVQGINNYTISTPLSYGIPILFSGCEVATKDVWVPIASGCMIATGLMSYQEFKDILNIDFDIPVTITPGSNSVSVAAGGSVTVTAQSSSASDSLAANIFAYTTDMGVARIVQTTFGKSISFRVEGITAGQTNIILFSASGAKVTIPVTVS